ncbi:hypothetical protein pEaSNUABM54_00179 [Erwinia phage pEa_SNUABM_54]|nr:hypothetical protein pEaSNUABM54_00179 [Erwinia phage pEa_SNUABM_54]
MTYRRRVKQLLTGAGLGILSLVSLYIAATYPNIRAVTSVVMLGSFIAAMVSLLTIQ